MTSALGISDNAVLLLAANLTSVPQLLGLRTLIAAYPDVLHFTAVLQILLKVLPETTSPEDYVPIVYRSYRGRQQEPLSDDISRIPTSFIDEVASLSEQSLRRKLAAFNLDGGSASAEPDEKHLTEWFFDRARRVEEATGMVDLARRLVLPDTTNLAQTPPFPPKAVTLWGKGIVQVLETFIFNNEDKDDLQLYSFEHLDANSAVRLLLSRTTAETVSRDMQSLIVPFVEYVQYQESGKGTGVWETVWDWLLDRAMDAEMDFISNLAIDWKEGGREDILRDFLRTCLKACYICPQSSPSIRTELHRIHAAVSQLSQQLDIPSAGQEIILRHPETDLLAHQLRSSSPLTDLTESALRFLDQMITSADIVSSLDVPLRQLVQVREGTEETQTDFVDQLIRGSDQNWTKRTEQQWRHLKDSLNWLQSQSLVLGRLSVETLYTMVLTALLDATAFEIAREIFVLPQLLPAPVLEKVILQAFYRFYDNATNGNRTRGGMKNAFQTLHVLDDPTTGSTAHAVRLVSATHALSNYSLSVTNSGAPVTPAQIRMNKDPAFLVCKVIENNPHVHRNVDRLIKVLDDLIEGTQLLPLDLPQRQLEIDRLHARVYAAIVMAALADKDFTTAYHTCVTNLTALTSLNDDTISRYTWEAFYNAGSYTSPSSNRPASSQQHDFQKMELLARAILVCPKEVIEDCLVRWTALETKLMHPELVPMLDTSNTRNSGEHSRGILATAADVGRTVARTASPLIGGRNRSLELERQDAEAGLGGWGSSSSRFGVRDSVKSGLTQGIGWLLGAPTQPDEDREKL